MVTGVPVGTTGNGISKVSSIKTIKGDVNSFAVSLKIIIASNEEPITDGMITSPASAIPLNADIFTKRGETATLAAYGI
jgi:hypothetical protein